jgi:hypothetical protein
LRHSVRLVGGVKQFEAAALHPPEHSARSVGIISPEGGYF